MKTFVCSVIALACLISISAVAAPKTRITVTAIAEDGVLTNEFESRCQAKQSAAQKQLTNLYGNSNGVAEYETNGSSVPVNCAENSAGEDASCDKIDQRFCYVTLYSKDSSWAFERKESSKFKLGKLSAAEVCGPELEKLKKDPTALLPEIEEAGIFSSRCRIKFVQASKL